MAVSAPVPDPTDALRKRLIARGPGGPMPDAGLETPPAPKFTPAVPAGSTRVAGTATPTATVNAPPATSPTAPAAPVPAAPPLTPTSVDQGRPDAVAAPAGGQDKQWLDWITATYGPSKSRGGAFADLPQGQSLEQVIGRFNQETGANAKYIGGPSGDRVDFGQGVTDALTSGGQLWSDYGAMSGAPRAGASGAGQATTQTGGAGGTGGAAGGGDYQGQIRALLMERLKQAGQPVDPTTGGIGEAMTGARLEASRATDTERKALAERRAATGDTSGTLEQGIQQSAERNAVGLGSLKAQLIQKEYDARRQNMTELLQLATASGDAESARNIQMKIAELDAAVRREGLGLDAAKYEAYLNQDAAKAGLNG